MSSAVQYGVLVLFVAFIHGPVRGQSEGTSRASVDSSGAQANGTSNFSSISADGRYVAFSSDATNLVAGDTNNAADVFVHDRQTGQTSRVSVDSAGVEGGSDSSSPSISADGQYVAFESYATNLVAGDTNSKVDVFVHDRQTGQTIRVSVNSAGVQGNSDSSSPSISGNGRYVAFESTASNLVSGDFNGQVDVFSHDNQNGTTDRVSVSSGGGQGFGQSLSASISYDGQFVAFHSSSTNLVLGDTNGTFDIFVRDSFSGQTSRVSVDSSGTQADSDSFDAAISADGHQVAFESFAAFLVAGDTNASADVFIRDLQNGQTIRVSLDSGGNQGNSDSYLPSISASGRYVAFHTDATNLVPGDTTPFLDVFIHDVQTGQTSQVSLSSAGEQANAPSFRSSISTDGRCVAFASVASNLVPVDTNGFTDIIVRDRDATNFTSLCSPGLSGVISCPCSNPPAGPDRGCDNSSDTGGASLSASGLTYLSADSLVFKTSGERPTALSVVLQGTTSPAAGVVYGQGVRCVGGTLKRLFTKAASGGNITAPDFGAGDPTVSARSAAKGDLIQPGQSRWYLVFYRDPIVLGGCPATSTFNATQTGEVSWWL